MNFTTSFALFAALSVTALAQTTTPAPKSAVHHTATTTHVAAKPVVDPKDAPPGVPKVTSVPKPLYALRYVDTVIGAGDLAEPHKFYTVHYTGWLTDGTKFDSSVDRATPITFAYGARQVIPGWDTGFEGMHVGGKRRLFIPYQLAYGAAGRPPIIPAKADLIFDLELISQSDTPPAPPKPTEPADTPAESKPATPPPTDTPAKTPNPNKP
jgi:peptidylprolyl isomerase